MATNSSAEEKKLNVAVIGAGPSGLSVLHAFKKNPSSNVTVTCYEKQETAGGLWNVTYRTGTDQYGELIHGSQYRHLWQNAPKETIELPDYTCMEHFKKAIPSYAPGPVIKDYILGRAKKNKLLDGIQYNTVVKHVSEVPNGNFSVTYKNLKENKCYTAIHSHVIVATGHFSVPNVPEFEGFNQFPGRILHSHDFRDARAFKKQHVLVIGGSYSAEDIALQCWKFGAEKVSISYRSKPMGFKWPESVKEYPLLQKMDGQTAVFADGSEVHDVDSIILCTGYKHHFPFMDDPLRLVVPKNNLYPDGLYKGVVLMKSPKVMYLGMQDLVYSFTMFDAQAFYVRNVCLGTAKLPSLQAMQEDVSQWLTRLSKVASVEDVVSYQTDYVLELCTFSDYVKDPRILDASKHWLKWAESKGKDILTYRDQSFQSLMDGTQSPLPLRPWVKAYDDSPQLFLASANTHES